jgi:CRISPR system Cascade subunit CasE
MYLSRLILNPRSRQVRNELADPYEMHRTVCKAFPGGQFNTERTGENTTGVLFRVDRHARTRIPTLLVQSRQRPDWSFLLADRKDYLLGENQLPLDVANPAAREINIQLRTGQLVAFRLRANPTFKMTTLKENGEKHKARLGIFKEDDQQKWLHNKLQAAGAELISVNILNDQFVYGKLFSEKERNKRMKFLSVQFDGVLQVKNPEELVKAMCSGFGSAKGLGFGLLSLARTQ